MKFFTHCSNFSLHSMINDYTTNALTLGLRYAVQKFPRGLLTGSCPFSWTASSRTTPSTPSNKTRRPQSTNSTRQEAPVGQSLASVSRPSPGPMINFGARDQFSMNDVQDLNVQLEKILLPMDNSSSRLSRAQSQSSKQSSRASIASERSNLSNVSEKPWKP